MMISMRLQPWRVQCVDTNGFVVVKSMTPNEMFLAELGLGGLVVPFAAVMCTVAIRRGRKGPIPSWADAAAIAVCFDMVAMASAKDWNKMFANTQLQDMAGLVLLGLLSLSIVVWIVLLSIVETANEKKL
jgi:hypothetical protein